MTISLTPPPGQGYNLQQVFAENKTDFWYYWADRWWKLPNLHMLDFEVQLQVWEFRRKVAGDDFDLEQARTVVNTLFDMVLEEGSPGQSADWRNVDRPLGALMNLLNQWSEESGADEGEPEASTGSSPSTGRPSKRTSKPNTASGSAKRSAAATRRRATPPANS